MATEQANNPSLPWPEITAAAAAAEAAGATEVVAQGEGEAAVTTQRRLLAVESSTIALLRRRRHVKNIPQNQIERLSQMTDVRCYVVAASPVAEVPFPGMVPRACICPFTQAEMPQQAIAATHMNVVPPLELVLPKPAHLALYVPGLHLLIISESLPPPPLLVLLIFRRLIALAADSGMSSSIYRPSTPTLLIPEKYPSSDLGDTHKKKEAVVDNTTHIFKRRMVYVKGLGLCLG